MKRPTRVAICSVGATVGFAFLVIIVGVDPLTAPMVLHLEYRNIMVAGYAMKHE